MKALAIAAAIVFLTLVLATALFAIFPDNYEMEPVAVLQIELAPEATEALSRDSAPAPETSGASPGPKAAEQASGGGGLPPGFAVLAPALPARR